ncbi:MAG: hypothetical protein ABN478_15495 [Mixta sp.]|uniref:hypothetical protein n=1 Tax=Mixta sp. Marseille-Q2659 TaxID=2736607 RepID=UPI0023B8FAEF|nr:hypothetical protein [Mixta sp. Marseille-Q2659]
MNKRILFAILAVAFLAGAVLRLMSGATAFGLMLLFLAGAAAWFSLKSKRQ